MGNILGGGPSTPAKISKKLLAKGVKEINELQPSSHRFAEGELDYLWKLYAGRFPKLNPKAGDILRVAPSFQGIHQSLFGHLFRVINRTKTGQLKFGEFIYACSLTARGSLDQKMTFLFMLFDTDEDKIIHEKEVQEIVMQIGRYLAPAHVHTLFNVDSIDVFKNNEPGQLTARSDSDVSLELTKFKERAVSSLVMENCVRLFDHLFLPMIQQMEKTLGTSRYFGTPLQFLLYREHRPTPLLLTMLGDKILLTADQQSDPSSMFNFKLDDPRLLGAVGNIDSMGPKSLELVKDVSLMMGLLRKFLADLPEPLLSFSLYGELAAFAAQSDAKQSHLQRILVRLPPLHVPSLRFLTIFLAKLISKKIPNITLEKLCVVFGPLLLRSRSGFTEDEQMAAIRSAAVLWRLVMQGRNTVLPAADVRTLALQHQQQTDALRAEIAQLRASNGTVDKLTTTVTELEKKLSTASANVTKMAEKVATVRSELWKAQEEVAESKKAEKDALEAYAKMERDYKVSREAPARQVSSALNAWLGDGDNSSTFLTPQDEVLHLRSLVAQRDSEIRKLKHSERSEKHGSKAFRVVKEAGSKVKEAGSKLRRNERDAGGKSTSLPAKHSPPRVKRSSSGSLMDVKDVLQSPGSEEGVVRIDVSVRDFRGLSHNEYFIRALVLVDENVEMFREDSEVIKSHENQIQQGVSFVIGLQRTFWERSVLRVSILHKGKLANESFMGQVQVNANDFLGGVVDDWFPLLQRKQSDTVSGEVHLRFISEEHVEDAIAAAGAQTDGAWEKKSIKVDLLSVLKSVSTDALKKQYQQLLPNDSKFVVYAPRAKGRTTHDAQDIIAISVPKLVELLCLGIRDQKDPDFVEDVLLTFKIYATPLEMFRKLCAQYVGPANDSRHAKEFRRVFKQIQAAVKRVLHTWTSSKLLSREFFAEPGMQQALVTFLKEQKISPKEVSPDPSGVYTPREISILGAPSDARNKIARKRKESFMELPMKTIAEQLTLIEHQYLSSITSSELIGQAWNGKEKETKARNVLTYIDWFNRISGWVATEIMMGESPEIRAAIINQFIELGTILESMNNFNGAIEILSALHSSPIARLKQSWVLVPKTAMKQLDDLNMLMNTDKNFQYYRGLLEKRKPPMLPYLGMMLTDLTFIDDANSDLTKGLYNFEKMRMMAGPFRILMRCVSRSYHLQPLLSVQDILMTFSKMDDQELYRLSKLKEPKGKNALVEAKSSKSASKKISQITQSMMGGSGANVEKATFSELDWQGLIETSGVALKLLREGKVVFAEGVSPKWLYRIKSGAVVFKNKGFGDKEIHRLGTGDVFGCLSVLQPGRPSPYTAVVVDGMAEVYQFPSALLQNHFKEHSEIAMPFFADMALMLAIRLKDTPFAPKKKDGDVALGVSQKPEEYDVRWHKWEATGATQLFGQLKLSETQLVFDSRLLGFESREALSLADLKEVTVNGTEVTVQDDSMIVKWEAIEGFDVTERIVELIEEGRKKNAVEEPTLSVPGMRKTQEELGVYLSQSALDFQADPLQLTAEDWGALTNGAKKRIFKAEDVVMEEGKSYKEMFQILRGKLRVEKEIDGKVIVLATLSASETLGDISFLTGSSASASVVADSEETECYVLQGYFVNVLFAMRSGFGGRFYKYLATLIISRVESRLLPK